MNGGGDALLMPVIDGRVSEPLAHLLNHIVRSACDKKNGGSPCSHGLSTVALLSEAQHRHGALDASDQIVVREGLGLLEPRPAEAAELQRGARWLAELVEAHQGHCVQRGAVLEKDLEGPPRPVGLGAREAYTHGPQITPRDYLSRSE